MTVVENQTKVNREGVLHAYNETKTVGLKKLLDKMTEYDIGYVSIDEYEKAKTYHMCECGRQIGVGEARCTNCSREIEKEKYRLEQKRIEKQNWINLTKELNTLAGKEIYKLNIMSEGKPYEEYRIKRSEFVGRGIDKNGTHIKHEEYTEIYKDQIYSRCYRSHRYALRVNSSNYDYKYKTGTWNWETKNLEVKLHKKCTYLLLQIKEAIESRKRYDERKVTKEAVTRKAFGDIIKRYYDGVCDIGSILKVKTYDGETFSIQNTRNSYTAKQIKAIFALLEKFDKENK